MLQVLKKYFPAWNLFELIWLETFSVLAIFISVCSKDNLLGLFTFLTGVLCVVLTAKGTLLFITLLTGFSALYIAIPLAIAVWSITGLCLLAFIGIRIVIWWCHG